MSLILPYAEWPAADRALWESLFTEGNPLDDRGPLVHLRQTSRETLARDYGRWLKWLADHRPDVLTRPPLDRATLDLLKDWLRALAHTAPMTQLMFVDGVLRIMSAAAQERDWSAQRGLKARLKRAAGRGDPRRRKQGRILSSRALLDAAGMLADVAKTRPEGGLTRATAQRDAAMVGLLALLPMRRRSLASLSLGSSVFLTEDRIVIALSGNLTKTDVPWEAEVPDESVVFLRRYLAEGRPVLEQRGDGNDPSLWLDGKGKGLSYAYIGPRIAEATHRVTGVRVPPHFFRDAAATTLARISPQAAQLIPSVLGHRAFETAERHYIQAKTIEAGRDYGALVARLKKGR